MVAYPAEVAGSAGKPVARAATLAIGFAFLAATAYLSLTGMLHGGDDAGYGGKGDIARSVEDWRRQSTGELSDAYAGAVAEYRGAPLSPGPLVELSRIAEAEGNAERAERLKLIAGDLQPRSPQVQAEAFSILLQRRQWPELMERLDGLIRAQPSGTEPLFAAAAQLAADPDARTALARVLAGSPPWRTQFLAYLAAQKNDPGLTRDLTSSIRAVGGPVSADELALVIDGYLRQGKIDKAQFVWLDSLNAGELHYVRRVYDGGFDGEVRNLRFDWTFTPGPGYAYRVFPRNTASMDKALQVDFLDYQGQFDKLSQTIRLVPGRYRLTGETRVEDGFQASSGLAFRLACLTPGGETPFGETNALPQSVQWIGFEKEFEVPAKACPAQVLRLVSLGGAGDAAIIRGQLSLDNLAIDNLPKLVQ